MSTQAERDAAAAGYYQLANPEPLETVPVNGPVSPTLDPTTIPAFNYGAYFGARPTIAPTPSPIQVEGAGALPGPSNLAPLLGNGGAPALNLGQTAFGAPPKDAALANHAEGGTPQAWETQTPAQRLGAKVDAAVAGAGPTAADDRAYEALLAKQRHAAPARGGSGGGSGGPSDYGIGAANKARLGAFDTQREGMTEEARAVGDRAAQRAAAMEDLARQQREDAAEQNAEREHANELFGQQQAEVQKQLDEVRQTKVDPDRLMRKEGMGIMAVIGGMLGGLYMGLNKLDHNPFIDNLNKQIDRDIAAQEHDIATARGGVQDKMNLMGQQRAWSKDNDLARMQARNLAYESVKTAMEAEAGRYDDPITQARLKQATGALNGQQAELQAQILERLQARAAAAAAARAAADKAARLEVQKIYLDTHGELIKKGASPDEAHAEATRVVGMLTGADGGHGAAPSTATFGAEHGGVNSPIARFVPTGNVDGKPSGYLAGRAEDASKAAEHREVRAEVRADIDRILAIREKEGTFGRTFNRDITGGLIPRDWQTQVTSAAAALKSSTNKASGLGAYDVGTAKLLEDMVGDLQSRGDYSDVQLREIRGRIDRADEVANNQGGGQKVVKVVGPDGRERIEALGSELNAPTNKKTVTRKPFP